jgi:hypothetical protein
MTLIITILSISTLSIMTLNIMTHCINDILAFLSNARLKRK